MKIIRVFPTKTRATPDDEDVRINCGPGMFDVADEVHISVTFTWDKRRAEELAKEWMRIAPVKIGGPAYGDPSGEFVPGKYVKYGYTITSRGCPNRCWFCSVWKREPELIELPIYPGNNVLDDNLLACSFSHIKKVFGMLKNMPGPKEFTGGFEAARLKAWHVIELEQIRPRQMFFAYDTPNDYEALFDAATLLSQSTLAKSSLRCYVLIGHEMDSFPAAEKRLLQAFELGFIPMAMLWRNENNETSPAWRKFQKVWARPATIKARAKQLLLTSGITGNTASVLPQTATKIDDGVVAAS